MKTLKSILVAGVAALGFATVGIQSSQAAEQPNIMIMGEDADEFTVPRDNRVFKRVLDALANEMHDEGFNVYDETALTLDDFVQGRVRRSDDEIIDIARSIKRAPIDVATIFSIYAHVKETRYTKKISTRVTGRLLNVRSGQRLGNFEVELPMSDNVSTTCDTQCLYESVGRNAKVLAQELGAVLAMKLDAQSPTSRNGRGSDDGDSSGGLDSAYSMTFNGFSSGEINDIEEYIVAFSGYKHHRPVSSSMRNTEYWYETGSDVARLNRNLRVMMDHLGVEGRVTFSGNSFSVEKIKLNRKNRD